MFRLFNVSMTSSRDLVHVDLANKDQVSVMMVLSGGDQCFLLMNSSTSQCLHPAPKLTFGCQQHLIWEFLFLKTEKLSLMCKEFEVPAGVETETSH